MANAILFQYGTKSLYGQGLYGGTPLGGRGSARVGTDFDVVINGVGLKLTPQGKKSYDKHNAQTFSYNPKTLFKQGDGAALVAKDLYYWSRLEHSRWDGGETYEPWQPDPTDPTRLNHKYAESFGFDVSDPHKLTHLREVYPSPSYEYVVGVDTPIAYWLLADHNGQSQMFDQISNNRTPGVYYGNVINDILPGPVVNDPNPVSAFDGSTAYAATGATVVPFVGSVTPTTAWSLEAWVNHAMLPQPSGVMALIGSEAGVTQEYSVAVLTDNPYNYWKLNETSGTTAVDSGSSAQNATLPAGLLTGVAGLVSSAVPNYGVNPATVGTIVSPYTLPPVTTAWSLECWFEDTGAVGDVFWHGFFGMNNAGATDAIALAWKGDTHHLGLHIGGVSDNDTGFTLTTGTGYYVVVTWSTGGPYLVYANGVLVATIASAVNPWTYSGGITFGAYPTSGIISKPAIYSTQLSATQIMAHYLATTAPPGGFGIAVGDGAGGSGSLLCARLPGVGWVSSGYTFGTEGLTSQRWLPWWLRPARQGVPGAVPQSGLSGGQSSPSGYGGGSPIDFSIFQGGASTLTSSSPNYQGAWYHVVLTYDGTNLRFYVNGALVGTVAATPKSTEAHVMIGAAGVTPHNLLSISQTNFFKGLLSQVAVYSTTLTLARIQAHYNQGTGAASAVALTPNQTYAKFVETYNGNLYINQANTNVIYSTDGGQSWTNITIPGGDVTTIKALWSKGSKIYVATANNVYTGDQTGVASFNGVNPALAGVTAGIYYSGQLYVGIGTALYYVDPATGIKTLLYDTVDFTLTFIEAFQGKIWFGGTNGRTTRLWTWTNNILPPSPANGTGAQVQDGTLPYGFIVRCSLVYLNTLLIGGTIAGDTTSEGQGAVYYVTSSGQLGQLCVLGPLMKDIRGTGLDYGVRSMWGAINMLWMGYSYNTGIARYDFGPGAFSSHVTIYNARGALGQIVNAVAYFNGKSVFATKDGNIWKEQANKVNVAYLIESEFHELPFMTKMIDGAEGRHSSLLDQQRVQVELSFDQGATYMLAGENSQFQSNNFDFPLDGVANTHWTSRLLSYRGTDATQAPEINGWSIRFAPQNSPKHEWLLDLYLPVAQRTSTGAVLTDAGAKLLAQLWSARESGTRVDFIDRDGRRFKVLVIEMHQHEISYHPVKASASQLQIGSTIQVELLEVQAL